MKRLFAHIFFCLWVPLQLHSHNPNSLDSSDHNNIAYTKVNNSQEEIHTVNSSVVFFIFLLFGVALTGTSIYFYRRLSRLTQERIDSINFTKQLFQKVEEERRYIANNLHDSVSHELLTLKNLLQSDIYSANNKIDIIINDVRSISRNLHPVLFEQIGLVSTIDSLVEHVQNQNDFMVTTEIDYQAPFSPSVELQLYRIIQEALSNIIKYADAYAAKVTLKKTTQQLFLEIRDNGKGFEVDKTLSSGKAFGLLSIIERARAIGGKAQFHSSVTGTIVTIIIPQKS